MPPKPKKDDGAPTPQKAGLSPKWAPGQSGNPKGRQKGSRNKLTEDFLADLVADWQVGGVEALKAARETKPEVYCKIVASLIPKEIAIKNELSEFTDEQLAALSDLIASLVGDAAGIGAEGREGEGSKARH